MEFGSQVLGETRKRIINVTNNGALGTQFIFRKITGTDFVSVGRLLSTWEVAKHEKSVRV